MSKKAGSPKADKGKENTDIMQQQNNSPPVVDDEKTNDSSISISTGTGEPLKPKAVVVDENQPSEEDPTEGGDGDDNEKSSPKKRKHDDVETTEHEETVASGDAAEGDGTQGEDDDEDKDGDAKRKAEGAPAAPFDLSQPIKRARTAYFIFSDEHRAEIQAKHKGEGVAVVARELGQMWAKLDADAKEKYQEKAALERERVAKQLEQLKEAGIDLSKLPGAAQPSESHSSSNALILPLARMRKICKLDPEVRGLSKEALFLVTKCTELATAKLGIETVRVAQIQNRRKLLPDDIAQVCGSREQFVFLRDDVKDLVREQVSQKQKNKDSTDGNGKKATTATTQAASNTKPLTAFFSSAK